MKVAYLDTSFLLAIVLEESRTQGMKSRLDSFRSVYSSNLLEAEFRSALAREGMAAQAEGVLSPINWVYPDRPLTVQFSKVLAIGRLRGADLWHLACALFLSPDVRELSFLTTDPIQKEVARQVGFTV